MEELWNSNGGRTPGCDNQQQPSSSGQKLRMPTVHGALPFTPLPSIVPFSPDIIQPPSAAPIVQPATFSNYDDIKKSKTVLDQLSAGAANAETASRRCQQSLQDVQRLLDAESLTTLTFQKPRRSNTTTGKTEPTGQKPAVPLSSFAKMVLDNRKPQFRYLTPEESPELRVESNGYVPNASGAHSLATPPSFVKPNDTLSHGVSAEATLLPSSSQQRQLSAVMPKALSEAQRAEYQYVADQDTNVGAQYLTPSKPPASSNANRTANLAQREQSTQRLNKLRDQLSEIIEKEDQAQFITSGTASNDVREIFESLYTDEGTRLALRMKPQSELENALAKVEKDGRLTEVETSDLQRIQQLSDVPAGTIGLLPFAIGDEWNEQDTDEWLQRIDQASHGLSAGRTLLLIMTGCASVQELQTEDQLNTVVNGLANVTDHLIIPIIEERPVVGEKARGDKTGATSNPKFAVAATYRQNIQSPLIAVKRTMRTLGKLLTQVDVEGSILSRVQALCKSIIFAENATSDKDAAIGVTTFEELRRETMDVYARMFAKHVDQRTYILSEILSSLEKLPATKQSARQYRLQDAKPIQLVSALLMRLVQTSATPDKRTAKLDAQDEDDDASGEEESDDDVDSDGEGIRVARKKPAAKPGSLISIVKPLHDAALANAQYIISKLIEKAVGTSKTGDEPYRRLLDIFTEDFINVLGSSDWPAAEMLLRTLVMQTIGLVEKPKEHSAPTRTLSLELLGVMGSGIIELQMQARHAVQGIDTTEEMADNLKGLMQQTESAGSIDHSDLVALGGPYRLWVEYLDARGADEKASLRSAHGYMLTNWAFTAATGREASVDSDSGDTSGSSGELHTKLRELVQNPRWLDEHSTLRIGTSAGRLAVLVVMLNSKLCRAFPKILNVLLTAMSSDQPTLRSRSLKSVTTLLEKDATMLDRYPSILGYISRCLQDKSALVRDSALTLLQKCTSMRPKLDAKTYVKILERTRDNNIGVRKRAMKMLKETYLRNPDSRRMRSAVVDAILWRLEDMEDSVAELARQTVEEIWFLPFHGMTVDGGSNVQAKLALQTHAALVIATVDADDRLLTLLEGLTQVFATRSKLAAANTEVCRTLITVLFDGIIDNSDIPGEPTQNAILRALTVFAKATPTLFTAPQLECLEPYTQNLTRNDELEIYRYVLTVLRHVMPHVTRMLKNEYVARLQGSLLKSCTRLQKAELREVAPCLWTINGILDNIERLVNFVVSVLTSIQKMHSEDLSDSAVATKTSRLMIIASEFGNACDLSAHFKTFKSRCNWLKSDSVPGLIVETLCSFSGPKQPLIVRRTAIDGICTVSQAWPKQFLRTDVIKALELVFEDRIPEIETVALAGFEGFFVAQEAPDEKTDMQELPPGIASGTERLGRTYVATDNDGALTSLAQRFLGDILRIALASYTEPAFIAAKLVVSVNKQGLVHPNESCPALVALETCPNRYVASAAFKEHKAQHQKHETLFEKEYVRAVQQTFDYQSKVIGDAAGVAEGQTPSAKLHLLYEVIKGGKATGRKKFLAQLAQKLDFDMAKLDTRAAAPKHLEFVRFCCENIGLFEYDKVEDVLHLIAGLEKVFGGTGSVVAQAIESEVLNVRVDPLPAAEGMINGTSDAMPSDTAPSEIDASRLRHLCVSAQIVSMIWETKTFLRKVWNMQKHMEKKKGKDKDAQKAPSRATNAPTLTENYLKRIRDIMGSATSAYDQRATCAAFAELMSIDKEVKVHSDDESNIDMDVLPGGGNDTPSESSGRKSPSVGASGGGRGRKRKASISNAGTPRKRGRPKKSASFMEDGDDGGWD